MMDSYAYQVDLERTQGRSGRVKSEGLPSVEFSAPPEFSGEPGKWTPEHLLVAAVASCFTATFTAIAEAARLHVEAFQMTAFGRLEKVPGEGYRFTEITLVPEIHTAHDDVEALLRVISKAEKLCFVAKSLRVALQVEPKFVPATAEVVG